MRGIDKTYRTGSLETHVLRGIDLSICAGEFVAIMGASGAGKTTLMNLIGLLDKPTSGSYWLGGRDVTRLADRALSGLRNRTVGFVFQLFHLLPRLSVLENVLLPVRYAKPLPQNGEQRAMWLLDSVGLSNRIHYKPGTLSGGQQQRVALARALVNEPSLLLADEPTGNLDGVSTSEILELFDDIHAKGCAIVLVTHEAHVAARAQRIITLRDGQIESDERRS